MVISGCGGSGAVCNCSCHDSSSLLQKRHVAPCCGDCPYCGQRIKVGWYDAHVQECTSRPAKEKTGGIANADTPCG